MENLLNRGLKFAVLPLKLDITQVLVDFKQFERSTIWKEFWYGREQNADKKIPIFRNKKHNLPKNYQVPDGLKTFLNSVKSEFMDHRNRNQVECNLPQDELNALKQLVKLQVERIITIKPCDKGAGIIILDFKEYMKACYEHLESKLQYENGQLKNYYSKVHPVALQSAKLKVKRILDQALQDNIISQDEYQAMNAEDGDPAKFYSIFKVHKDHKPNSAPPTRPIISAAGSVFENIGKYLEYHIKNSANTHKTYLQDTPHFLRIIEETNRKSKLSDNSMLVTIDVKALFTNILHEDGLKSLNEELESRKQEVPTEFLLQLMEILLKHNIFIFDEHHYKQDIGSAMGSPPVPSYANIFMARQIDPQIQSLGKSSIKLLKRYLDDLFLIFQGTSKELHLFFDELNKIHPTIKFTMNHTSLLSETDEIRCSCEQKEWIPFLDTKCSIENNKIETDLYRKETDRNQYLLTSSCHALTCLRNVPFSLALRIVRICSKERQRDLRFEELKNLLLARGYSDRIIESALNRARLIPRKTALLRVFRNNSNKRSVFAVTYDPRLPSLPSAQAKHWRAMVSQDSYLAEVFPQPPLTAFKRQKNLRDFLIRAKVPKPRSQYPSRNVKGMKKCGQNCTMCPYVTEGKTIKIGKKEWKINSKVNCVSYNLVYLLICKKDNCKENFDIGETKNI